MAGRSYLWWFVAICIVAFVWSDPAGAADLIRSAFGSATTFISTLAG
jgi:hypothetical protein